MAAPGEASSTQTTNGRMRDGRMHDVIRFFRAYPQALVLLVVCLVLGIGTFLAIIFGLLSAGSTQTSGEPSGVVTAVYSGLW